MLLASPGVSALSHATEGIPLEVLRKSKVGQGMLKQRAAEKLKFLLVGGPSAEDKDENEGGAGGSGAAAAAATAGAGGAGGGGSAAAAAAGSVGLLWRSAQRRFLVWKEATNQLRQLEARKLHNKVIVCCGHVLHVTVVID